MTEKRIAANRANAQKSTGPRLPEGKARASRNACKHHLYARKFLLPPAWAARIRDIVQPCADTVEDPVERACLIHYFVLELWKIELFALETRLLNQYIARHRSYGRGLREYARHDPLFFAILARNHKLYRDAERARRAWESSKRLSLQRRSILQLAENKPVAPEPETLTLAAAAGSGVSTYTRTSPLASMLP
ncbi:MAG: hypothetical protein Q7U75_14920, partial [Desulfobacterales bacterium]|nr:hypothetical protein [Desulfobacterales bacterium]